MVVFFARSVSLLELIRPGSLNVFVPAATICTILLLGLWLPSRSSGSIIAFAALYGLVSGAFLSDLWKSAENSEMRTV